jgi:uncharacterized protein (DUF885 family)
MTDPTDVTDIASGGRHPIFTLSDHFVDEFAAQSPMTASYLGIPGFDHLWDDTTPEGVQAMVDLLRGHQRRLAEVPPPGDDWDALAIRIQAEFLALSLEPFEHDDHLHELGHLQSLFPQLRDSFDVLDEASAAGWRNIAARLGTIGEPLAGLRACLEAGRAKGLVAPKRQTRSIVEQLRLSVAEKGTFTLLVGRYASSGVDDPELPGLLAEALANASDAALATADWLEQDYLPTATERDGVGEERYRRAARSFLGTDLDLHDTYRWGWDHLLELRAEMEALAATIDPDLDLDRVVALLSDDPSRGAPTQEEFRAQMHDRIRAAIGELEGEHFDIPEEIKPSDVRLAPMGSPLGAYFVPPSEDFTRPGTTWWSIGDQEPVPLWDQITTAYHEGFPGHHLQCGIQTWLSARLSRVHRLLFWLPGYGEGWALYAERLMRELGYFEKPEYELGLLAASALRAVRVAIDIGSHLELPIPEDVGFHAGEPWTFETAVEALEHFAFVPHEVAVSEVTRYLGWPGQAIAYKVGERAILALREDVRRRDGDAFDLKAFHAQVLGAGPVGLDHLRELVLGS